MSIPFCSAIDLCAQIRAGERSSVEIVRALIEQIENFDPEINAVIVRDFERALDSAKAADRKRSETKAADLPPLHGLPLTVKESLNVSGLPTTWGKKANEGNIARSDAEVVMKLNAAGAIILGKTNVPDGVADHQTSSTLYGVTNNPWNFGVTCGGSSGGSAAALAAGFTSLEVGSDLAGSLRVPAHFCGVYSHKPSYGLISAAGHSLSDSAAITDLTVLGPMARSAQDLGLLLDLLVGPDDFNALGWKVDLPRPRTRRLNEFRVAVLANHEAAEVDRNIQSSILALAEALRHEGARVEEQVEWPIDLEVCHSDYLIMTRSLGLRHSHPAFIKRLTDEIPTLNASDTSYRAAFRRAAGLSHYAWHALNERRHAFRLAWRRFFEPYDVIICPAHSSQAFPHNLEQERENRTIQVNGRMLDYNESLFWLAIAGLNYLPATVCPIGVANGLPIGVQVIGPYLEDRTTLRFAELLEGLCPRPDYPLERESIAPMQIVGGGGTGTSSAATNSEV